jgi:hypothetical protein
MSMVFVLLLLPQWLESNTQQKDTIYKDILWQQGENPVFLFDNFFKVWDLPYLKILCKKILHLCQQMEDEYKKLCIFNISRLTGIASRNRQNFYPDDSCAFAFWSTLTYP